MKNKPPTWNAVRNAPRIPVFDPSKYRSAPICAQLPPVNLGAEAGPGIPGLYLAQWDMIGTDLYRSNVFVLSAPELLGQRLLEYCAVDTDPGVSALPSWIAPILYKLGYLWRVLDAVELPIAAKAVQRAAEQEYAREQSGVPGSLDEYLTRSGDDDRGAADIGFTDHPVVADGMHRLFDALGRKSFLSDGFGIGKSTAGGLRVK